LSAIVTVAVEPLYTMFTVFASTSDELLLTTSILVMSLSVYVSEPMVIDVPLLNVAGELDVTFDAS
jgi:hypothetical protein